MKLTPILGTLILAACWAHGQGTLQFDQQISDTSAPGEYVNFSASHIVDQSFVPALSSVDFVQLYVSDPNIGGSGVRAYVDLWSGTPTSGTLLGSTPALSIPVGFNSPIDFLFSSPISVTSGNTYYLQLVNSSGDSLDWGFVSSSLYPSGSASVDGTPQGFNMWFREGIIVPEPSFAALTVLGLIGICPTLRNRCSRRPLSRERKIQNKIPCSEEPLSRHFSPY